MNINIIEIFRELYLSLFLEARSLYWMNHLAKRSHELVMVFNSTKK
jgi:hypothetical protein